jgi:hypothetical protein
MVMAAATVFASPALADQNSPSSLTPGIEVFDETSSCTAAFAAQGNGGNYLTRVSVRRR